MIPIHLSVLVSVVLCLIMPLGVAMAEPVLPIVTPNDARTHDLEDLFMAVRADGGVPKPDLSNVVHPGREIDRALIKLGKLLFWDQSVGSKGQACASCHFHGGADNRIKNQVNPGLQRVLHVRQGDILGFHNARSIPDEKFHTKKPNQTLRPTDFPLIKNIQQVIETPNGTMEPSHGNSNDVVSSQGVLHEIFLQAKEGQPEDVCAAFDDPVFHNGPNNTRRVEPRNTPTVINAMFNAFNFWDGRANHFFNGINPFGIQDPAARILVVEGGKVVSKKVALPNSALASQAVGPPLSRFEMSCGVQKMGFARTWPIIGRKLLRVGPGGQAMTPLQNQRIHPADGHIGDLSNYPANGANVKYADLIRKVFLPKYWNAPGYQTQGGFTLMEANFSFFFGLAVQRYEQMLLSDQTWFDRWMRTGRFNRGFGPDELAGLNIFVDKGKCVNCHGGPEFTNASVRNFQRGNNLIEPMLMGDNNFAIYDNGFYNTSVTPTVNDLGRGGKGPTGAPLSSSRQRLFEEVLGLNIPFQIIGGNRVLAVTEDEGELVCNDANGNGFCDGNEPLFPGFQRAAVDGAMKTPGLRNQIIQGPYFHNGSMATLRQVVEFYDNGGNFCRLNRRDLDPDIQPLGLTEAEKVRLVKFLVSLTDIRVMRQRFPFDHPSLEVPIDGHQGGTTLKIAEVGRRGVSSSLKWFLGMNPQFGGNMPVNAVCSKG